MLGRRSRSGTNFSGAIHSLVQRTNASFTLNASNQIVTTVPAGATTGPISVIAPGGLAVARQFHPSQLRLPPRFIHQFSGGKISPCRDRRCGGELHNLRRDNLQLRQWVALLITNPGLCRSRSPTRTFYQRFYRVSNPDEPLR